MTSGIVKFFVSFLRTTGAGLLAPHRAVLIEDVIDPKIVPKVDIHTFVMSSKYPFIIHLDITQKFHYN